MNGQVRGGNQRHESGGSPVRTRSWVQRFWSQTASPNYNRIWAFQLSENIFADEFREQTGVLDFQRSASSSYTHGAPG